MSVKQKKVKFASDMFVNFAYDSDKNELSINNYLGNPLKVSLGGGNIDIHDDKMEINNDNATLGKNSCCIHTIKDNINIINITFQFSANEMITDNLTYLTFLGDFTLPLATFLTGYDITTGTPDNSLNFYSLGRNIFSLYGAQKGHTYIGTLNFAYLGGNND